MAEIQFENGAFDVDAAVIGRGFGLEASVVPTMMRDGRITSRCERGEHGDAGRYRLTFFHEAHRLRLIIDSDGSIIESTVTGRDSSERE